MLALASAFSMAQAQDVKGDVKAGEKKNAMCIGCHGIPGYQASFPQVHRVPMISGQNGKYIAAALDAYRKGDRKHPSMRGIGAGLSDQDIADLAAFYEQHGRVANAPKAPKADIPASLQAKMASCVACHGDNFSDTTDPANPRLAGQHADYLYVALRSYKGGNHVTGRNNATMVGMVAPLSDKDMKQIANFLGSLPGELKTIPQARTR
ncbi:c-type cytochrome [Ideonella paludis]|nr:c-type cytochrome [Ideonella paludis]